MRAPSRILACWIALMLWSVPAWAQYMRLTTDNPADNTRLRTGVTNIVTITLDTNHDRNGSVQTCNSHTSLSCGAPASPNPLDMFSYTIALKVVGGTVSFGTYTAADASYTDVSPQIQSNAEVEINKARPTGTFTPPGLATLGTIPVTVVSGAPAVQVQIGASGINPFGFGTGFGTECDAFGFANTYVVGDPTDPCGVTNGIPGDWFDWDGVTSTANRAPTLNPVANMNAYPGCGPGTTDQPISGSDPDGDALTFSKVVGPTFMTVTTTSPTTGKIHLAVGVTEPLGTHTATVRASDGALNSDRSFTITVSQAFFSPTLNQPANMTVTQGATADQTITATDACGNPLTFSKVSGPTFVTVTTTSQGSFGVAAVGNIHLAPGAADVGTSFVTISASDGTLNNQKGLTITVTSNHAPILNPVANMNIPEGDTQDQAISGSDADGDALTFTKVTGPSFMTVTTTSPTTGNIHVTTNFSSAGTYPASVAASDGQLSATRSFTINVCLGCRRSPVLAAISDMTVTEGMTADQAISAVDPDGDPITFLKVSGPIFMTVSTTAPGTGSGTGNIHLAPGQADAGAYAASAGATDGVLTNIRSFAITAFTSGNHCPTSNPGGPYSGLAGVPVGFDGSASSDPDGNSLAYAWDFDASNGITVDATGVQAAHVYPAGGTFTVTLTVTDNGDGDPAQICSNSATTTAAINAACPVTVFNGYDTIRLNSGKRWFAYVQPSTGCTRTPT